MKNQNIANIFSVGLIKNITSLSFILSLSIGIIIISSAPVTLVHAETTSVNVNGIVYDVEYSGDGVSIATINADLDFISLILDVSVSKSPGILEITLERSFFDSIYQGTDESFLVLADGDEPTYSEIDNTDKTRTLRITLASGTEEVEIIGSVFGKELPIKEEPNACTMQYDPVCGKDGNTYGNSCLLNLSKVSFDYQGECIEILEEIPKVEEEPKVPDIPKVVDSPKTTDKPKVECGSGTVLKSGVCVVDERCGPGTVLKDGSCVVEYSTEPGTTSGLGKQLVYSLIAAFVIAGVVGLILALMSKASKSKD